MRATSSAFSHLRLSCRVVQTSRVGGATWPAPILSSISRLHALGAVHGPTPITIITSRQFRCAINMHLSPTRLEHCELSRIRWVGQRTIHMFHVKSIARSDHRLRLIKSQEGVFQVTKAESLRTAHAACMHPPTPYGQRHNR